MKKYRKILLLLPFLSKAMPGKDDSEKREMLAPAQLAQPRPICYDVFAIVSEFMARPNILMLTNSNNLNAIISNLMEEIYQARINSPQVYNAMIKLGKTLQRFASRVTSLPDYISLWGSFPKDVKTSLRKLVKEEKYKSFDFSRFGPRVEIPGADSYLSEDMFDSSRSDYVQNMFSLGCMQRGIFEKIFFKSDLSEDGVLCRAKNIVSKFEYVTKDYITKNTVTEGTLEREQFLAQLAKKNENDICFIVRQKYAAEFAALCGTEMAKMNILLIIEEAAEMKTMPFYPASLSTYALGSLNIRDQTLQNIQFLNRQDSQIGLRFLKGCIGLKNVDLSGLEGVTAVGADFLENCFGLTNVNLEPLSQIIQISDSFLSSCIHLTSVDLSPLSQVTQIGNYFLDGCYALTSIDLSPLSQITQVGNYFLDGCYALTSIDLSPLSQVTQVGSHFLAGCSELTNLDLSQLNKVKVIEEEFLTSCDGLTSIDLSPLNKITRIGFGFMSGCEGLTSVDLSFPSEITDIQGMFLNRCSKLTHVNLSGLKNVTQIRNYFLNGCPNLTRENVITGEMPEDHPVVKAVNKVFKVD